MFKLSKSVSLKFIIIVFTLLFSTDIKAETLIVDDPDWPPFFFGMDKTETRGIGKEIICDALKKNGYKVRFEHLPIKRANLYIKTGELDIAVYSYKKERENFLIYCDEPLYIAEYRFAVRSDSNIKINSLSDIETLTFGYLDGLTFTPEMLRVIERIEKKNMLVKVYSLKNLIKGLAGKYQIFDVIADSPSTLIYKAKTMDMMDRIRILDYKIGSKKYYIAISKKSKNIVNREKLKEQLDSYLRKIKENGSYKSIFKRYGI